jgi:hypothetical protein
MSYGEQYISTAYTIKELVEILSNDVPEYADIEIASGERSTIVEVWYNEGTNTVVLR